MKEKNITQKTAFSDICVCFSIGEESIDEDKIEREVKTICRANDQ